MCTTAANINMDTDFEVHLVYICTLYGFSPVIQNEMILVHRKRIKFATIMWNEDWIKEIDVSLKEPCDRFRQLKLNQT